MNDLPIPPIDADVDLTDFPFMALDVRRLRDSRFAATAGGAAFMAGLLLWCASWHQVPAASLPDDDVELASLAGFGKVVREWRKVRTGALYGWTLCSDGRLYHPTVAEKACEAWESKLRNAYGKMHDRLRKLNKHRDGRGLPMMGLPSFEEWNASGRIDPIPPEITTPFRRSSDGILLFSVGIPAEDSKNPALQTEPSAGIPTENALIGIGIGIGIEEKEKENPPTPKGGRKVARIAEGEGAQHFGEFWSAWPSSIRKGARGECERLWRRTGLDSEVAAIVGHVRALSLSDGWTKEKGAFVPAPLVYLRGRRWEGAELPDNGDAAWWAGNR